MVAITLNNTTVGQAVDKPGAPLFGSADWKASPTDSVGFCGQGNNWYPGANPPSEWWEGTTAKVKVKVGQRGANFVYGEYPTEMEVDGYADNKSKKRLWAWRDSLMIASFSVFDVSDPAKPKLLAGRNLLGNADTPADIADKYFPEFRKPERKQFALGYYLGIGPYFGVRTGGVTAHGNRLYIQSQTHLYCIGEQ